ncbi:hypothetical protein PTKIN_Ptkin05aG0188200 [Pterospermum kingtungense]
MISMLWNLWRGKRGLWQLASRSAIEGLEKVSGMDGSDRVFFLQGKGKDEEAKRMPCGHVYHGDCIVQWPQKSHLCPLCRYAMPTW